MYIMQNGIYTTSLMYLRGWIILFRIRLQLDMYFYTNLLYILWWFETMLGLPTKLYNMLGVWSLVNNRYNWTSYLMFSLHVRILLCKIYYVICIIIRMVCLNLVKNVIQDVLVVMEASIIVLFVKLLSMWLETLIATVRIFTILNKTYVSQPVMKGKS
jgi:hypothetical protein